MKDNKKKRVVEIENHLREINQQIKSKDCVNRDELENKAKKLMSEYAELLEINKPLDWDDYISQEPKNF